MPRFLLRGLNKNTMDKLHYYLNTGLKVQTPYGFRPNGKESTGKPREAYLTADLFADIEQDVFNEPFKPLMRPLSSLTKEITVEGYNDGKPFVPLIKLYEKIGHPTQIKNMGWVELYEKRYDSNGKEYILKYCDEVIFSVNVYNNGNSSLHFTCKREMCIINHFDLYELFFRWHLWIGDQSEFGKSLIEIKE